MKNLQINSLIATDVSGHQFDTTERNILGLET